MRIAPVGGMHGPTDSGDRSKRGCCIAQLFMLDASPDAAVTVATGSEADVAKAGWHAGWQAVRVDTQRVQVASGPWELLNQHVHC